MASTTLEETVQREQEEFEREKTAPGDGIEKTGTEVPADGTEATLEEPDGQTALIDRSQYEREDLAIAKVDGQSIDRIRLTFSGTISLDRSEPADVALWNKITLGTGGLTLMVEGQCSGTGAKEATSQDGDLDVIVGVKTVKITTIYIPAAEELETELARTAEAA